MTDLMKRVLRRLDEYTSKTLHSTFSPLGRNYLAVARRAPRG